MWFVDVDGHGTHTAGTVGAIGNNSLGVGEKDKKERRVFLVGIRILLF